MKLMIFAAAALMSAPALAGTVVKEGPNGTSVITRTAADGTVTTTETWTGDDGGLYERTTVCQQGECMTGWTLNGRKARMSSGERSTVFGEGQSTTTATVTGVRGQTRERVIERTRTVRR